MSRVITFSRQFPAYHPKAGQPTYFVEKLWNSLPNYTPSYYELINLNPGKEKEAELCWDPVYMNFHTLGPKLHTIRAGHRWKTGDKFGPRVWSGKPYRSPQIAIGPDIEIKKTWDFEINQSSIRDIMNVNINGVLFSEIMAGCFATKLEGMIELAKNDGLSYDDFLEWFKFPKPFSGQIICWDENVNY